MAVNPIIRAAAAVQGMVARRNLRAMLRGAHDVERIQQRVLMERVAGSAQSRFGIDHGLSQVRTYEDYVARVPVLDYDRLAPYIEPIKNGDVTGLFNPGTRLHMLALTSGTTGAAKFLPVTDGYLADYRRGWNAWGIGVYNDHPDAWLRTILQVTSPMDEQRTAGGLCCGAISGFIHSRQRPVVKRFYAAPDAAAYIKDADAKYYTIVRLAIERDVAMIATANPSTTLRLAMTADRQAQAIIRDVRDGTLRADIEVSPEIRSQLAALLGPNPRRAAELDRMAAARGRLLPMDFWKAAVLANWTGGTVGLYVRSFAEYFGDTPVRNLGLVASEARITVPLADATPAGLLEIFGNFYEFIPADQIDSPRPDVLRCHELAVGRDYFVLLTTSGGLFRYHIGDVVRCEGFLGRAPMLSFLNKGSHVSSITGEKLSEHQVVASAQAVAARLGEAAGASLGDFVLCPRWADPPYYALNIEPGDWPRLRWDQFAREVDAELARANIEYQQKRQSGRLGPIVVAPVQAGFFARLQEQQVLQCSGRREQYKHRFLYSAVDADASFQRPGHAAEGRA